MDMFLSEIADSLSQSGLTDWEVTHVTRSEVQLYSIFKEIENIREVVSEEFQVRGYIRYEKEGRTYLGESSFVLMGDGHTGPSISAAMERARLIANQPFALPGPSPDYPVVHTSDSKIESDPFYYLNRIHEEIVSFSLPETGLSSSEIYITSTTHHLLNSKGLNARQKETEIMLDFVFLSQRNGRESESQGMKSCRFYEDLDTAKVLNAHARYACDLTAAQCPRTGTYDVIFAEEALDTFFDYFIAQAGGQAAYQGWSQFKEGAPIIGPVKGDKLTLISDPFLSGGMRSRSFDENGLIPKEVTVIKDNVFRQRTANKRYADYLNIAPTGAFANVVVPGGNHNLEHLMSQGPLLYVHKFSTFSPNPVTGAFSGEIRVGYFIDGSRRIPVKGGSVSGTMRQALEELYFSRELTKRESYLGPVAIKVCRLKVGGD